MGYFSTSSFSQEGVDKMFHHAFNVSAEGKDSIDSSVQIEDTDRSLSRDKKVNLVMIY